MNKLSKAIFFLSVFFYSTVLLGQNTYRDNFSSSSYSRNDGNSNFSSNWIEEEDDDRPGGGDIRINEGRLRFRRLEDDQSIRRSLNLSGASSVILTLDYDGRDRGGKTLLVQLWNGSSWQTVLTLNKNNSDSVSHILTVNQISSSSGIRFISGSGDWGNNDYYYIDNVLFTVGSNEPPTIIAIGDQTYCPGVAIPIVESVSITDPDDSTIDKVFVQISSHYDNGKDLLALTGSHPYITASWNALEGKLTLTGPATFAQFEAALRAVVFNTTATVNNGNTRNFSIVLSEANYLTSTGHYYEYVPAVGITWTAARDAAASRKFYGLQGYLATIINAEEAVLLGKQSQGAGWIGGSDATSEGAAEGQWKWVTGPEAGTQFWSGAGNGSVTGPFNYANWNNGEPNNSATGGEHYAHIYLPGNQYDGTWNDLSNIGSTGDYQPKGYLVEYGGMPGDPPYPKISAVTGITVNSVSIVAQPIDQIALTGAAASFMVTANNADTYQWQVSTNGGGSFVDISDGKDYSGTRTNTLSIPNSNMAKNGYRYRVMVSNSGSDCPTVTSGPAILYVGPGKVITNKRITYRVKAN